MQHDSNYFYKELIDGRSWPRFVHSVFCSGFVFDVVPPRQYVGAKAYRKDWKDFFASFPGPVETFEISDLGIMTDGNLGFSHSIQRAVFTDKNGKKVDMSFRLTDVYRKINGKWLIIHEHVSVPVDLATGKGDLSSKP
jgi:ketosteroid isomerase-like protein